jgi:hypothetical protein
MFAGLTLITKIMKSNYLKISIFFLFFTFSFVNAQQQIPLVRYYSNSTGKHFYTTKNDAPSGYVSEGILVYVLGSPASSFCEPIFLLYNSKGDRLMTTSVVEKNNALSLGFTNGGIVGYTNQSPSLQTVYRYYNGSKPEHFYTNDYNELGSGRSGYSYEGSKLW